MVRSLAFFVALAAPAAASAQPEEDPWFGRDKALHFGVSAAVAAGGYWGSGLLLEDPGARLLMGAGLALTLGVAKEVNDLAGHGHPSWRDLAWDVLGAATGLAFAWAVESFVVRPLLGLDARPRTPAGLQQALRPGGLRPTARMGGGVLLRF